LRDSDPKSRSTNAEMSAASASLDPQDWGEFSRQAHRMLDDMLGSMENIREQRVWQPIPDEVRGRFRETIPKNPADLAEVHREFMTSILPYAARNAHPGFLGWVQGGGTPVGMLAEMLAAGLNANVGGRDQIPLEVERQVTDWMRSLFGFPQSASGLMVTGTSMANFLAVVVARDARLGCEVRRSGVTQQTQKLTAYASKAVHGCVARAFDFAGLGSDSLRLIPVDNRQRMDLDALATTIAADRQAGCTPFFVVGTAGTVDTGAIDDLAGIASLCAEQQLWFHVDGASGALAVLAPDLAPRLKGIEQADSLAFDFHKWAQVPYDAGFILVRDGEKHKQAFSSSSAYLMREERGMSAGSPWPCDLGPELSRGFRALKTWATLKVYGTDAIGAVISHSCALARSLASQIAATPELELMATVELNIVCFRYRFGTPGNPVTDEVANELSRKIVIELQESGAVVPSTTLIDGRVAIRAAFVNHRTTRAEVDTLVNATLAAGRALRDTLHATAQTTEKKWEPWLECENRVLQLNAKLDAESNLPTDAEAVLRIERATLLAQMGRNLEARSDYLRVLEFDPANRAGLIGLGRLLVTERHLKAAQMVYTEAVRNYPDDIVCRVNLGGVLLERDDYTGSREQYEAALTIDTEFPQAHGGMYYALTRLGEFEAAASHQRKAFGQKSLFTNPYRGTSQPVLVLLLVSSTGGNTPLEKLIDDRVFQTYVVVADFYDTRIPLPEHHLVINGIGDSDAAENALLAAESLVALTQSPVINLPAAVRATGRCENAARLANLPSVIAPATATFPYALLAGEDGPAALAQHGFVFPLLLRAPGFHMGQHFELVETAEALSRAVTGLPGAGRPGAELLVIQYLDARGADGCARKYRVMFVDGRRYPLHLAISPNWKIHYFSADMKDRPDHRAEEASFLADMVGVLGDKAMVALERVQAALGLDYGGIDFGLSLQGEVLLFEANATMVVEQPDEDPRWDYRRAAVARIHAGVREMLMRNANAVSGKEESRVAASMAIPAQK
jgi:glutamate/tyrosine decarboxylase-like PLP-dependent enzyme/Flp pilus assembly protein TadD